jgi:hypothetical protein
MGNSASSKESSKKEGLDDFSCLEIQNSAIFNDTYVAEIFEQLPEFEGTELEEVIKNLILLFQLVLKLLH